MARLLFAFASAVTNAPNVVTQHVARTAAPARDKGWRLAMYLIRNPLWLFGVAAMVGASVFQALALYFGRLSVVQSILVTEASGRVVSHRLGIVWAALASFIKSVTDTIAADGLPAVLARGAVYGIVIAGIAGFEGAEESFDDAVGLR